jgi:Fe2+ transport system protein B
VREARKKIAEGTFKGMENHNDRKIDAQAVVIQSSTTMKKIDRYILTKFLGTFVFIMLLLLGITIVIDLSEKIDNFVEHQRHVS